jgi:hypothetical protein
MVITAARRAGGHDFVALRASMLAKGDDSQWPVVDVFKPGFFPGPPPGLWLNAGDCRSVKHSFRLSPAGLPGGQPETPLARCAVGRTLSIRVRATFSRWHGWFVQPARPRPRTPRQLVGQGTLTTASILVRTRGRPVAYALLTRSGDTTLITAAPPRCTRS